MASLLPGAPLAAPAPLPAAHGLERSRTLLASTPISAGPDGGLIQLSTEANNAFLRTFADAIPPGSAMLVRKAFEEVHGLVGTGGENRPRRNPPIFRGDPRWPILYRHPLVVAVFQWAGAGIILQKPAQMRPNLNLERGTELAALFEDLESHMGLLLKRKLDAYWAKATRVLQTGDTSSLHDMESLSLSLSLTLAVLAADKELARPALALSFIKHLSGIWQFAGIPGEEGLQVDISRMDDFLFAQIHICSFWFVTTVNLALAAATNSPPVYDPVLDHPSLPSGAPIVPLISLPAPSEREPNGPTPAWLLARMIPLRAREQLGWMDPLRPARFDWDQITATMLKRCISGVGEGGLGHLVVPCVYLGARTSDYRTWLRNEAGLRLLDVLMAEELLRRDGDGDDSLPGLTEPEGRKRLAKEAGLPRRYLERLSNNSFIAEAVRRRRFLRDAAGKIEAALPAAILDAARAGEVSGVLSGPEYTLLVPFLAAMRQMIMVMDSPEPFEDLGPREGDISPRDNGHGSNSGSSDQDDEDDEPEPLMRIWFNSATFGEAANSAAIISRTLRSVLDHWPRVILTVNLLAGPFSVSAIHAAWMHLLVLRRFRWLLGEASEAELAGALDLYNLIRAEIETCLELLDATGKPHFASTRTTLQGVLNGTRNSLSRSELQMLRLAKGSSRKCPHGIDSGAGTCWSCTVESETSRRPSVTGLSGIDEPLVAKIPLIKAPKIDRRSSDSTISQSSLDSSSSISSSTVGRPTPTLPCVSSFGEIATVIAIVPALEAAADEVQAKKRVRFADEIEIWETHHNEDYPARSQHAPDEPEDIARMERLKAEAEEKSKALGIMLLQRGANIVLPDLRSMWTIKGRA